jgi:hypothetical protein
MKPTATLILSSALLGAAFAAAAAEAPTSKTAIAAIAESTSAILQADSARALAALEATPAAEFQG